MVIREVFIKNKRELRYNWSMNVGRILLGWLIIGVIIVAALVASGMLSVHIEIMSDEDDENEKRKRLEKGRSSSESAAVDGDDELGEGEEK